MANIVKSAVITGNGTNCEMEMAHACRLAGSEVVDILHISELLFGEKRLDDYHFLNLPGGFSTVTTGGRQGRGESHPPRRRGRDFGAPL
jgi:phosphoribosylformylglycinamidine (FGAM) synthase-like amidotransferase family enzyme